MITSWVWVKSRTVFYFCFVHFLARMSCTGQVKQIFSFWEFPISFSEEFCQLYLIVPKHQTCINMWSNASRNVQMLLLASSCTSLESFIRCFRTKVQQYNSLTPYIYLTKIWLVIFCCIWGNVLNNIKKMIVIIPFLFNAYLNGNGFLWSRWKE